jgi:hypothetical protein
MFVHMASAVETTLPRHASSPLIIVYQALARLTPDRRNARTHPKRQIEQIVASIRAFGFANPILVDEVGGIIAGHGRLLAAKLLGRPEQRQCRDAPAWHRRDDRSRRCAAA